MHCTLPSAAAIDLVSTTPREQRGVEFIFV
jgi:hypothetical protein